MSSPSIDIILSFLRLERTVIGERHHFQLPFVGHNSGSDVAEFRPICDCMFSTSALN